MSDTSSARTTYPVTPAVAPPPATAKEEVPFSGGPNVGEDGGQLEFLARLVIGALVLGGEELAARARRWQNQAPGGAGALAGGQPLAQAGYGDIARYLLIGMATSGRRTVARLARVALSTPGKGGASLLAAFDRLTGSTLLRPIRRSLRRPLVDAIEWANLRSRDWIEEGWQEEQISRWIAANATPEILEDVIDIISQNPELAELVRNQISQQSVGVASSVVDTSRKLSGIGDDVAEHLVRRLLLRGRRPEITRIQPVDDSPPIEKWTGVDDGNHSA